MPGSIWLKMKTISVSSTTFSTKVRSKAAVGPAVRGRGGQPRCSACLSADAVSGQSRGGRNRLPHHARSRSAATPTTMAMATPGDAAIASVQELSVGTPKTVSFMKSVKSSCAMWIHHSCGSLMKIQIAAAMTTIHLRLMRNGLRPSLMASMTSKKYSNVFGKTKRIQRAPVLSNRATPRRR